MASFNGDLLAEVEFFGKWVNTFIYKHINQGEDITEFQTVLQAFIDDIADYRKDIEVKFTNIEDENVKSALNTLNETEREINVYLNENNPQDIGVGGARIKKSKMKKRKGNRRTRRRSSNKRLY